MPASKLIGFNQVPSAGGEIARWVYARLRKAGIQLAPILSQAGLTAEQINDRAARLTRKPAARLLLQSSR